MRMIRLFFWRIGYTAAALYHLHQWWWQQSLESQDSFEEGCGGWETLVEEMSYLI